MLNKEVEAAKKGAKLSAAEVEKAQNLVSGGGSALGAFAKPSVPVFGTVLSGIGKAVNAEKELERERTLDEIEKVVDAFLNEAKEKYGKEPAIKDKLAHIERVVKLVEKMAPGNRLAAIAAKCHDLGRIPQFEMLGGFLDGKTLHHYFGEDLITRWLFQGKLKPSHELDIIRQVVMFHGRERFMPFAPILSDEAKQIVNYTSRADGIENGCIGFMEYGEREVETDAKEFKKNNPELDMKSVSPEVLEFFMNGEKFDKMKYCNTYAEYILFACVLAVQALKGEDREIAQAAMEMPCTGYNGKEYENALEGYKDLFTRYIDPAIAEKCYERLVKFYKEGK